MRPEEATQTPGVVQADPAARKRSGHREQGDDACTPEVQTSQEHEPFHPPPDGLSHSPRPPASHQVRREEPNDQGHDGEDKIAVDVLAMVEEVPVNHFVDDDDHDHDQQPDSPVGNEMLPHTGSIRFSNRFVKPSKKEEDSWLRERSGIPRP
jgi:hypothetical protein